MYFMKALRVFGVLGLALAGCSQKEPSVDILDRVVAEHAEQPHLARSPSGEVVLSYVETRNSHSALRFMTLQGNDWSAARTVAKGKNWFVSWADFPSVIPFDQQRWAAHWLVKKTGGPFAYDAMVAVSNDGGERWGEPVMLHDDNTLTEHGFVSLFDAGKGLEALWLDGRAMASPVPGQLAGTQLRTVRVEDGSTLVNPQIIDSLVCDCCQTDAAMTTLGPIVAYRNRTEDEIRDIYVARRVSGVWEKGRVVAADNWVITGCPVNGPAIDAAGATVVVAWFTGQGSGRVRLAFSTDNAFTFSPIVQVTDEEPLGRIDVQLLNSESAMVSWVTRNSKRLVVRQVSLDGALGPVIDVAAAEQGRGSGFPQMIELGGQLLFAWTDTSDKKPAVRTKIVAL